jgi:hypothetical protein
MLLQSFSFVCSYSELHPDSFSLMAAIRDLNDVHLNRSCRFSNSPLQVHAKCAALHLSNSHRKTNCHSDGAT